jgi:hypothetical protein
MTFFTCVLCRTNPRLEYLGNFCEQCGKIKVLMDVYSPSVVHTLIERTLVVNDEHANKRLSRNINDLLKKD